MSTPSRTADASTAIHQPAPPAATEVAALTPPDQSITAKPDDGWLSALMGKWIADLEKHYPATLRLEGVQGKVVLVAMLHENGTLTDVKIAKSSGNIVLDRAAIADVEQGPPIKLSRPLGRPQRPIKFSISYDLKTAR
ncbi:MAG: energy transducer TonB [Nitrospira sp.]|nr:energy transducer TonB [Nitrospira sp.]